MEHEAIKKGKPTAHDHHAMMEVEMKRHFIVAVIFTIPVLILSPSIQGWFHYSIPSTPAWNILLFVSATIVILYGGLVFYRGSISSFRMHTLDMNVLVSIALLSGYLYSAGSTFLCARV
jgi:Cu2+-exporting ATPase